MALLVNGERVENATLEEERRVLRRALAEKMPEEPLAAIEERAREWAPENVIERLLLKQAALRDPEPIPPDAPGDELSFRVERLIARLTAPAAKPRRKDVVEFYRKNASNFQSEETVHAAHIVRNVDEQTSAEVARQAIEQARQRLEAGEPFEKLADEFSDCPGRGGDLGTFPRGHMVEAFDAVAFTLAPGQVSDIFRTPFGFHIVKVYSRRPPGPLSFEEVSNEIEELLWAQKKQKLLDQHLDALRARAEISEVK